MSVPWLRELDGRSSSRCTFSRVRPHMQAAAALASFEPIVCEVVDSISA